jgi:urea transport system permease protein
MITRRLLEAPDSRGWIFLAILAVAAIAVPLLNLAVPPSSPWHVPTSAVALWGKYLCYALLALSLDLVWGYCGILSLGHGAFFALGGYAMGMYMMRQIGTRGVYAHPVLPDFMVFLNWPELPVFWWGFNWFAYAALMVLLVPGALAFVFGWFAFRSRVTGVYLSIITQALTFALMLGFFRNNFGFGGNNGLTDFKDILGFNVQSAPTRAALFALSAVALGLGYLIAQAVVRSKAGKVLIAIRDAESRTRFLGYRVENYKTGVFTLSACMASVAGALYVPQVGIINPSEFAPANSIEYVIWVAVGGRGTLVGAALGAVVVNYAKTTFTTGLLAPYWLFALGALFVLVTIFLPRGILGLLPSRAGRVTSGFPSPLWGGVRGGGNPDTDRSVIPASLSLPHKGGGDPFSGRSANSAMAMPSASSSAVSKLSASRVAMSGRTTMRSTTTSMSCLYFLSSFGASAISQNCPLTLTRWKPFFMSSASSFLYSPFLPRTIGASR